MRDTRDWSSLSGQGLDPAYCLTRSRHASGQTLVTWSLSSAPSLLLLTGRLRVGTAPIYPGIWLSLVVNQLRIFGILIHAGLTV